MNIPLINHHPHDLPSGIEIDGQTRRIDIMPTILCILEIEIPETIK